MEFSLVIPAFIAGLLTFLAPCTLPMVPGYLSFISGVGATRRKIFLNGLLYVIGFSAVFILLGSLFGLGGAALIRYRVWLSRIGGGFVILFGLSMMRAFNIPIFKSRRMFKLPRFLKPGHPLSSLVFGSSFAFGWTPCVGPILGSVLLLASSSATVAQGAFLLTVFSLGLAVPFLAVALGIGSAPGFISRLSKHLHVVEIIGGIFLILLGLLLLTNNFTMLISYGYRWFSFIEYDRLLDYL